MTVTIRVRVMVEQNNDKIERDTKLTGGIEYEETCVPVCGWSKEGSQERVVRV